MRFDPAAALRFFRRSSRAHGELDPADMGTAFGLEATLEGSEAPEFRNSGSYESLESQEQKPAVAASPMAWMHRKS